MTPAIELKDASRAFGTVVALDRVSLTIAPGEFFALLGPSSSGKTTCLRLIAGFDHPDSGRILLEGEDVTDVPPYDRNVNTVFQDYALFPHMTVAENVAYGLRVRGVGAADRGKRAVEMLELVRLGGYGDRRPAQLSGGQRHRVALARALINQPKVLLLDEPLGALDLKLREEMQTELKGLQQRLGITFVFVTHDQGEALSMADRVQLSGEVDTSIDVQMYDIELFDVPVEVVSRLQREGRAVVCYISAGTYEQWRPDQADFPPAVLGKALPDWPSERWLDIRQADQLAVEHHQALLRHRVGCHVVELICWRSRRAALSARIRWGGTCSRW